jgi:hypothetical protein
LLPFGRGQAFDLGKLQEVLRDHWLGGRDSNPDTQIQSPSVGDASKEDQQPDAGKIRNAGANEESKR